MTKQIPLSQHGKHKGKFVALVDDDDFERVAVYHWSVIPDTHTNYARGKPFGIYAMLHRYIMNFPDGEVDHRNGNGLDCRKSNLRVCTHNDNMHNRRIGRNNTIGYKGVHHSHESSRWVASITLNKKVIRLGTFKTTLEAAQAYDRAAVEYFGDFAALNFPNK